MSAISPHPPPGPSSSPRYLAWTLLVCSGTTLSPNQESQLMFYIISWWTCLDIRQISAWWDVSSPGRLRCPACRRSRPCLLETNTSGKWISSQAQRSGCWWRRFWISSSSLHYFLSSARSCLKMKRVINLFGQFMFWMMGWPLIWCPEQTPTDSNNRPVSLVSGQHLPIRGQGGDLADQ